MKRLITTVSNLKDFNMACVQYGCRTGAELEDAVPWLAIDHAALAEELDKKQRDLDTMGAAFTVLK